MAVPEAAPAVAADDAPVAPLRGIGARLRHMSTDSDRPREARHRVRRMPPPGPPLLHARVRDRRCKSATGLPTSFSYETNTLVGIFIFLFLKIILINHNLKSEYLDSNNDFKSNIIDSFFP